MDEETIMKLLLLGPGSTGKSTLFKSLKILHNGEIELSEKEFTRSIIRQNIVLGMQTLIQQSHYLYQIDPIKYAECKLSFQNINENKNNDSNKDNDNDNNTTDDGNNTENNENNNNNNINENDEILHNAIEAILAYNAKGTFSNVDVDLLNYEELINLALAIQFVQTLPSIQATFHNHGKHFAFSDNLGYFFENASYVFNKNYIPSDSDCLKNRAKTAGYQEFMYAADDKGHAKFKIVDVGGQRAERRKWINYFDKLYVYFICLSLGQCTRECS